MKTLNPTIELEQQLGSQIYTALQGPVVEEVASAIAELIQKSYFPSLEAIC